MASYDVASTVCPAAALGEGTSSMYEYCFDQDELAWKEWMKTIPPFRPNAETPFSEIIVPTADTVRYTYIIDRLLLSEKHVLCVGETGTGRGLHSSTFQLNLSCLGHTSTCPLV